MHLHRSWRHIQLSLQCDDTRHFSWHEQVDRKDHADLFVGDASINGADVAEYFAKGRGITSVLPSIDSDYATDVWVHVDADGPVAKAHFFEPNLNRHVRPSDPNPKNVSRNSVPVNNSKSEIFKSVLRVSRCQCGLSIAKNKVGLSSLLTKLVVQRKESNAGCYGSSPTAQCAHPFSNAVLLSSNAPRVLTQDRRCDPIGSEPADKRANDNVEPENETAIPHERMRSTSSAALARAAA